MRKARIALSQAFRLLAKPRRFCRRKAGAPLPQARQYSANPLTMALPDAPPGRGAGQGRRAF